MVPPGRGAIIGPLGLALDATERAVLRLTDAMTRDIAIRSTDTAKMPGHCERAGFETVISVPVRLHERMVGELNLFYRSVATPNDEGRHGDSGVVVDDDDDNDYLSPAHLRRVTFLGLTAAFPCVSDDRR